VCVCVCVCVCVVGEGGTIIFSSEVSSSSKVCHDKKMVADHKPE
jgi:hypothetical protein